MGTILITGSGVNSKMTLAKIHAGMGSFKKDTSTIHSQVTMLQQSLTQYGFDTHGADGKYGNNTANAVKQFQKSEGLTADGLFGKKSLAALETNYIQGHLDPEHCKDEVGGSSNVDKIDATKKGSEYKVMKAVRINTYADASEKINAFSNQNTSLLTVSRYLQNLDSIAKISSNTYTKIDCSGYTQQARKAGYHGSTTNFTRECAYYGYIPQLGGIGKLIPDMELYQACRKTENGDLFWTSHIGVYYGLYDFGNGPEPAVYQSASTFGSLRYKYQKDIDSKGNISGPNLTSMNSKWNYWGWSKFIRKG